MICYLKCPLGSLSVSQVDIYAKDNNNVTSSVDDNENVTSVQILGMIYDYDNVT